MHNFWTDLLPQVINVAGFTALMGLIYAIGANRSKKPHFDFLFSYQTGTYNSQTDEYSWQTGGIIKNRSTNENTIVRIYRIVWKNKKKNSYLANSLANIQVKDKGTNRQINLPLYFLKKQAFDLEISTKFQVTGTSDEQLLRERVEIAPNLFLPKYKYELCFEDIEGNFFDQQGKLVNLHEADFWWTLVNTFESLKNWNIKPFLKQSFLILLSKISFSLKKILWALGI
ncbi:MAG TPA: hypothetical protein VLG12_03175 [Candidatus Saccharimonadales bacterium]|nr:hypothetical protein [Candidatus Saccharimonadales bacterium]